MNDTSSSHLGKQFHIINIIKTSLAFQTSKLKSFTF